MKTNLDLIEREVYASQYFGAYIDRSAFVILPSPVGGETKRRDQAQLARKVEVWGQPATPTDLGVRATDVSPWMSVEAYQAARAFRAQMLRDMFVAASRAVRGLLRGAFRVVNPARRSVRASVAAAFRRIARGVDERTAHRKTRAFYISSGAAWTRRLV